MFDKVFQDLQDKKLRKEQGKSNGVPYPYERMRETILDIEPGSYHGILGASGAGKSKFTRATYLYHPLDYSLKTNYPLKIIYFALEDPKTKIYKNIMCHYLFKRHKYSIGMNMLESKGDFIIPKEAESYLLKDKDFYKWIDDNVLIIEDCLTPDSIEAKCDLLYSRIPPDQHVIVIVDNYANLVPDDGKKDWDAVRYFSRNIVRLKLCKEYNWTVIAVLQEDVDTDKNRFRSISAGRVSIGSLEPNMDAIAGTKIIRNDLFYGFGFFYPWKYELLKYPNSNGYDLNILRNNFRAINCFKNNEAETGTRLGLYFDKHEHFREMPPVTDQATLEKIYRKITEEEKIKAQKFVQNKIF